MIELCQVVGIEVPDPGNNYDRHKKRVAFVQTWIEAGADPDMIRKTVRDKLAATSSNPRSLQWFDGAVRDAIAAKRVASTNPERAGDPGLGGIRRIARVHPLQHCRPDGQDRIS